MNTPNPLIPQGSLEAQQHSKRSMTKLVVSSILAAHGVVLGGLLFLGCRKEEPEVKTADTRTFESLESPYTGSRNPEGSSPFGDLGTSTNAEIVIPAMESLPVETNQGSTFPPMPPGATGEISNALVPATGFTNTTVLEPEPAAKPAVYAVLPGDNFSTIAKKHGIPLKAITAANPNVDSRKLKVGQVLNLPANVTPVTPPIPSGTPTTATAAESTYTVKSGDTLTKLARDYKVSIKDIQRANNIKGSNIRVGQKLIIPAAPGSTSVQ